MPVPGSSCTIIAIRPLRHAATHGGLARATIPLGRWPTDRSSTIHTPLRSYHATMSLSVGTMTKKSFSPIIPSKVAMRWLTP